MVERLLERGFNYLDRKLRKNIHYYKIEDINAKIKHFHIERLAILTDGKTRIEELSQLQNVSIVGYFSFSLDTIGTKIDGFEVKPLLSNTTIDTDGWLVSAMNEFAGYSLNQYLSENSNEKQVIIQHIKAVHGTTYYSYIDFFSNEQRTMVQLPSRSCWEAGVIPHPIPIHPHRYQM